MSPSIIFKKKKLQSYILNQLNIKKTKSTKTIIKKKHKKKEEDDNFGRKKKQKTSNKTMKKKHVGKVKAKF